MSTSPATLSEELVAAVERAGRCVVTVHGRPRITSSGVHWAPGVVVTAEHSLKRDEELAVTLPGGQNVPATLAGRDPGTDLAVLKLEAPSVPVAETAPADSLRVGHLALALGRSAETGLNAALGVISSLAGSWRTWRGGVLDQFVRLDITLYPGASGGAAINTRGEVIGIGTSGLTRFAPLAVPVVTVNRVVHELLAKGRVSRGFLGVGLQRIPLPKQLNLSGSSGVIVLTVEPDGPADRAGVFAGDIFVALNGKPIEDTDDVQLALGMDSVGKPLEVRLVRGGTLKDMTITIGERPSGGR